LFAFNGLIFGLNENLFAFNGLIFGLTGLVLFAFNGLIFGLTGLVLFTFNGLIFGLNENLFVFNGLDFGEFKGLLLNGVGSGELAFLVSAISSCNSRCLLASFSLSTKALSSCSLLNLSSLTLALVAYSLFPSLNN